MENDQTSGGAHQGVLPPAVRAEREDPEVIARRKKALGCLVRGPLGCLAFCLGALVVFAIFMPPVLGKLFRNHVIEAFGEHYEGSLEVRDAWLFSMVQPQSVEGILLRDPDGREVLRGELAAGPIWTLAPKEREKSDPLWIHVSSLDLAADQSGRTGLERALERSRPEDERPAAMVLGLQQVLISMGIDEGRATPQVPFRLTVDRLRWSDSISTAAGSAPFELQDLRGNGRYLANGGLVFEGVASLGPEPEGGTGTEGRFSFSMRVDRLNALWQEDRLLGGEITLESAALDPRTALPMLRSFGLFTEDPTLLETLIGDHLDHLSVTLSRSGLQRVHVQLGLQSERLKVEVAGELDDGHRFLLASAQRADEEPQPLRAAFALDGPWYRHVAHGLLPLFETLEPLESLESELGVLRIRGFRLPLNGNLRALSGAFELDLGRARYAVQPGFLPFIEGLDSAGPYEGPIHYGALLSDGIVNYDGLGVPLGERAMVLAGSYSLESGNVELEVKSAGSTDAGAVDHGTSALVSGTWLEPEPVDIDGR